MDILKQGLWAGIERAVMTAVFIGTYLLVEPLIPNSVTMVYA